MIYSDAAEPVVRDVGRQDSASLKLVAASVLERSDKAARICTLLTESAKWAVRTGCLVDMRQIATVQIREVLK
ncbi:hypothetical protein CDV36_016129 [Fusarium kuroshium]|uniref:Uncharacterized protein n=1 Tax=Fusarium kuroshium TaxID=2010991 RepID=A0A3M2QZF8_9HYPO|nr:hypothetical protein CDV36_016129 [Fusarium kuroshium]